MSEPFTLGLIAISFLLAGTVKGSVGIGLPTAAMGLMTLVLDPRTAISLILMPMLFSNAWQVYRAGGTGQTMRRYLPLALSLMIGVAVAVSVARDAPDRLLLALLGLSLLIFVAVNASRWAPEIPDSKGRIAQLITGTVAGLMGGVTSVWAPPMAVYLAARRVGKDEFVRASGLLIFLGSVPLALGYMSQGYLTREIGLVSLVMLIPTFAGFAFGERLRRRVSEDGFRLILLVVFALMGLNLIRRAIF